MIFIGIIMLVVFIGLVVCVCINIKEDEPDRKGSCMH